MAKDAVDVAVAGLGRKVPASVTDRVPVLGAAGFEALRNNRRRLAERAGLPVERVEHLLGRYGSCVEEVLALVEADPGLGEPIPGAEGYLKAEAVYAATHEGRCTWRTSWSGAPGSSSRSGITGSRRPPRSPR